MTCWVGQGPLTVYQTPLDNFSGGGGVTTSWGGGRYHHADLLCQHNTLNQLNAYLPPEKLQDPVSSREIAPHTKLASSFDSASRREIGRPLATPKCLMSYSRFPPCFPPVFSPLACRLSYGRFPVVHNLPAPLYSPNRRYGKVTPSPLYSSIWQQSTARRMRGGGEIP